MFQKYPLLLKKLSYDDVVIYAFHTPIIVKLPGASDFETFCIQRTMNNAMKTGCVKCTDVHHYASSNKISRIAAL